VGLATGNLHLISNREEKRREMEKAMRRMKMKRPA